MVQPLSARFRETLTGTEATITYEFDGPGEPGHAEVAAAIAVCRKHFEDATGAWKPRLVAQWRGVDRDR